MPGQSEDIAKGGTLRLGSYPCDIAGGTLMEKCYGSRFTDERHRHRYEFNNDYRDILQNAGLTLSGLSLLGLSSQPPTPEWGFMLSEGRKFITAAPWLIIWPGSVIVLHVVIFNLLGDSLRDILDPRYEKQKRKWRKMKQWQANA
jgi:hypothetical protein